MLSTAHARRWQKGVASGLDAINHGHHFARDEALGDGSRHVGWLYYHMRLKSLTPNRMSFSPAFFIVQFDEFFRIFNRVHHFEHEREIVVRQC